MTVSAATRNNGKRTGPLWSTDGSRKYTDQYTVITSGDNVDGDAVLLASGLAGENDSHPSDSGAIVTRRMPNQQTATTWFVNVTWASKHGDKDKQDPNPLNHPTQFRWERVDLEESRTKDLDGKFFVNVNGGPLRNPPKFPISRLRLIIEKNEAVYSPGVAFAYGNTVNRDPFLGQASETAKMELPTAVEQFNSGAPNGFYWKIVYAIEFKVDKWNPVQVLNEGTFFIDHEVAGSASLDRRTAMTDGKGVTTGGWGNLALDGSKLPKDADPALLDFRIYELSDFDALNLF